MKADIQAKPEASNTRSERNPTAAARMARPPISNVEFEISNPDQNSGDFIWRRSRFSEYAQNYQTKPCARRAVRSFNVPSCWNIAKRSQLETSNLELGTAFENYQTKPPGMDHRFKIPDLRGREMVWKTTKRSHWPIRNRRPIRASYVTTDTYGRITKRSHLAGIADFRWSRARRSQTAATAHLTVRGAMLRAPYEVYQTNPFTKTKPIVAGGWSHE